MKQKARRKLVFSHPIESETVHVHSEVEQSPSDHVEPEVAFMFTTTNRDKQRRRRNRLFRADRLRRRHDRSKCTCMHSRATIFVLAMHVVCAHGILLDHF